MIAVVLAAGRGTRLGGAVPKPLVPIGGVAAIDRVLAGLAGDGFDDVVVVTGHEAERVETHLSERSVRFARQAVPAGTADALVAAQPLVAAHPFVVSWADVIVPPGTYRRVAAAREDHDAAVAVNHLDDVSSGGLVSVDHGIVIRLDEKPGAVTGLNLTGVMALGPGVWAHLGAVSQSPRGELELPDALNEWIGAGARIAAVGVHGPVFEIGTPDGRDEADAYFSSDDR